MMRCKSLPRRVRAVSRVFNYFGRANCVGSGELDQAELRLNELENLVNDRSLDTERGAIYFNRGDKQRAF